MLEAERTWTVEASVEAVYAVIADVERYPDWHPFFGSVDVLERDRDRRAVRATCTHPTPVATLTTEITFTYDPQAEVEARRAEGDLKDIQGLFTVKAQDALSVVTHRLLVDPGHAPRDAAARARSRSRVRNSVLNGAESGLAKALAGTG